MERKEFIKKFAIGGSILFAAPTFLESCAVGDDEIFIGAITIDLTSPEFSDLNAVGGFAYKDDIIIARTANDQYIAMSKICTHQGCTVAYSHTNGNMPCPCHGSVYDLSGNVIGGPAPAGLQTYSVMIQGESLILR